MLDLRLVGALASGACIGAAVIAAGRPPAAPLRPSIPVAWLEASKHWRKSAPAFRILRGLGLELERAGWRSEPEAVLLAAATCSLSAAALGLALGASLGAPGALLLVAALAAAPPALLLLALSSAKHRRRRLAGAELASILELLGLELSGGGSAQAGLAAVLAQTGGPLARALAELLAGSQLGGGPPFDVRLEQLAGARELPALRSLAAVLAMSRHYGSGVGDGVRALAADLRRTERRDLIARNRRAVNRVLVPAAIGVLLPFIGILLYPAVTSLLSAYS
jgi:Flp pilus assembly protein TadB